MLKTFAAAALAFSLAGGPAVFIPDRAAHADALSTALGHLRAEGAGKPALETAQLSKAYHPTGPAPAPALGRANQGLSVHTPR